MKRNFGVPVSSILATLIMTFPMSRLLLGQQATGSIRGTVSDPSGAVVPHVQVQAVEPETGFTRLTRTDARGNYSLVRLPIGPYRLEAAKPGFKRYIQLIQLA